MLCQQVNCRIGSLENFLTINLINFFVNCRIGSLEMIKGAVEAGNRVNCRIGSLEIRLLKMSGF